MIKSCLSTKANLTQIAGEKDTKKVDVAIGNIDEITQACTPITEKRDQ